METFKAPFKGRSLLNWIDWTPKEINTLLDLAFQVKAESHRGEVHQRFLGKTIALIFEKRSTRTRSSFETAFGEEGGHPVFMSTDDIQLGGKESVQDTARVLGRMFNAIEFRGFKQEHVEQLAQYSGIPVINGLTDEYHPTQMLADIMTMFEEFGEVKDRKLVFLGDARNNVANSLMVICSKLGIDFCCCAPSELFPKKELVKKCREFADAHGSEILLTEDVNEGMANASAVYTDVWVSMGEDDSLWKERIKLLTPYRVTKELMKKANKDAIFLRA